MLRRESLDWPTSYAEQKVSEIGYCVRHWTTKDCTISGKA
jgi:hypothetical protein